jgi:hypothetical protein
MHMHPYIVSQLAREHRRQLLAATGDGGGYGGSQH